MHEHRAMRFTLDESGIKINGVNFKRLLHVEDKEKTFLVTFTEEERNHVDFTKFYIRFFKENVE